jgi:hypothetical protein
VPVGGGFSLQLGYGHSFDRIEVDSSIPVNSEKYRIIIGLKSGK